MRETGRCAQVRAAARLNSAGCRAFRLSVEARHRGFAAGHRVRLYLAYKKLTGSGRPVGGLGSSWGSSRKAGRGFPPCAARFGSSDVRSGRSHNNLRTNSAFGVAPLGSC